MKKLGIPNLDPVEIFLTCVDGFSRQDVQNLFYESVYDFTAFYERFEKMAPNANLRNMPVDYLPNSVTKDQWIKLYDDKLVQSKNARPLYDIIKTSSPNAKCPLCGSSQWAKWTTTFPKLVILFFQSH